MDMSNVRPELHVAQQSRRDKLRIQQSSAPIQHFEDFTNNLEPSPVNHSRLNPDLVQVRHVRNANFLHDPTLLSSSVINFSVDSDALSAQREAMLAFGANLPNMSHPASLSTFHAPIKVTGHDPNGCENWKGLDSQQSYDWMVNYANEHAVTGRVSNQNAVFVGEVLSNDVKVNNVSAPTQCLMPNYDGCQDVQSSLTNPSSEISSQDSQKHYGDMRFGSSASLYQNGLQNVVTVACVGTQNMGETGRGSWSGSGDELALLPSYGNQSNALRFDGCNAWWNRPVVDSHPWSGELSCIARKSDQELSNVATDATMQGLSLSLSSNPLPKMCATQFAEGFDSHHLHLRASGLNEAEDSKTVKSGYLSSITKPPMLGKSNGKSLQDVVGTSNHVQRHSGPLGPFTGYATILKSSRFLKPAQELLDDFCCATKLAKTYGTHEGISGEASASASIEAAANAAEAEAGAKVNNSGASSSTFHCFSDIGGEAGVGSSSCESYRPEYQQKKAKLLYLQEEVCRRYKLYYQQMEMVVSSFESVSGLRAATPYVSLALKTISRNFRCMKSAISEQIKHVLMASGEDLLSPATGASSSKGDMTMSKLKYMERHKYDGENVGFLESQHVWRPQRGLPERSVAILRAWLFDHFLHPYPTDTDKHMLATQTGLSRNQVSNWFINARVRVWKPMVEEIHMLETKGLVEANQASSRSNLKSVSEGTSRPNSDQEKNKVGAKVTPDKQFECSGIGSLMGTDEEADQWNQEKPLGLECQVPASMDGSLMGFVPFQRSGLDQIGGVGSVSLTLGLRHGVESAQKQQQLQHQEDQLRQQFGGQMIHDFVG